MFRFGQVMPTAIATAAIVFISACVIYDVRSRRIPNFLSLIGLLVGVALNVWLSGGSGLLHSGLGVFIPVLLLLPAFALGGVGGGDVKMMAALGAMLGARLVLIGLLCGLMAGGVFMLVHLWRIGRVREKVRATVNMIRASFYGGSLAPLKAPANDPTAVTLPYSVPLGLGVLLTLAAKLLADS